MDIKQFRISRGVEVKDMVSVLRDYYPGYDKSLQSKVENPDKYGVRLLEEAEGLLLGEFAQKPSAPPRPSGHKLHRRVQARLTEHDYGLLQLLKERYGYPTMQITLTTLIKQRIHQEGFEDGAK